MSFGNDLKRLCDQAKDKSEMLVRKVALEMQSQMIERSPVDSGRFRHNWQCGIGAMDGNTSMATANDALGRASATIEGWKPGQTIWLTNSLPYAHRLEFEGWSKQAPSGMVRLTVQNYSQALAKTVSELK